MSEDIVTRLQAMYHSEQLSAYIVSKLPKGKLTTGWIEQGLLSKGFTGNLQDKKNQVDLIIPIDRFTRLTRDYDAEIDHGLFILGEHGLNNSKLINLVSNLNISPKNSINAIGFNSNNIQTQELIRIILRFLSEKTESVIDEDPNLDYIEELVADSANGEVRHLLSLSLPSGTLEIFRKTKNAIAAIILVCDSQIVSCFWDSPQNLATFAIIEGVDIERVLRKYSLPLWYTSNDVTEDKPKGPQVVIKKRKRKQSQIQERVRSVERIVSDSVTPDSHSLTIVRTLLTEIINRLSPLISHIDVLEKRITKITKDTRKQSMSEHSENAIEEIRRIEKETKILEDVSNRLRQMEKQIENITSSDPASSPLSSDEIQGIVSKMAVLRELIDKIEVEIDQLDSRVSDIESLIFKRQTES